MRSVFLNMEAGRRASAGFRAHVGVFGKRNVGKSSLLNSISGQNVSIVSEEPGTTTDPVKKAIELPVIGPTLLIDTAGFDDLGELGNKRVRRSKRILDRTDFAVLVCEANGFGEFEEQFLDELEVRSIPAIVVFNKVDLGRPTEALVEKLKDRGLATVYTNAITGEGIKELNGALVKVARPDIVDRGTLIADLVGCRGIAVLVVPIDRSAPKGRLILPQTQAIRELLDYHACCVVTQAEELALALDGLKCPPSLVVTDSQAFDRVATTVPAEVPLTSFSILFSRLKGDLEKQVRGALAIDFLRPGDRVLVAEACSHHPQLDDIGRVQIPRLLANHAGGEISFDVAVNHDLPNDLSKYQLVIHCGACMWNRREMQTRILYCEQAGVPITNYGLAIALTRGILDRALAPFPSTQEMYRRRKTRKYSASGNDTR